MPILRTREDPFRVGDHLYNQSRLPHKQPNGYIIRTYTKDNFRYAIVRYFDDNDTETFDAEDFEGKWTDGFGGTYYFEDRNASAYVFEMALFIGIHNEKLRKKYQSSCGGFGRGIPLDIGDFVGD